MGSADISSNAISMILAAGQRVQSGREGEPAGVYAPGTARAWWRMQTSISRFTSAMKPGKQSGIQGVTK